MATSTTTTTSAPTTAPEQTPPVDSGVPSAAADAAGEGTPADDCADSTSDTLEGARRSRDKAKQRARDAEARADALAARVVELEAAAGSSAAERTTLTARLETFQQARRDALVAKHVEPSLRAAATLFLASAGDVDDEKAIARLHELGLVRTRSTPIHNAGISTEPRRYDSPI